MILIAGNTGSGKTVVTTELAKKGYTIIPTYTTRKPRPNDNYTICVSEEQFQDMLMHGKFASHHYFVSELGTLGYGIPLSDYKEDLSNSVVIIAEDYYDDICHYVKERTGDSVFLVYIDVDDESIISKSMNDSGRGLSNLDLKDRLDRDRSKNQSLRSNSSLIIANYEYGLTPLDIANIIDGEYKRTKGGN